MAKKDKAPEFPEKIKFKYIFDDFYNPIYVNGAYGGISPNREIIVNFYLERVGLPYSQTLELDKKGKLGPEVERHPEEKYPYFVRVVENGIILTLENAKKIHSWLGEKIKELEDLNVPNQSEDISTK